jgi:hypothetical protein
LSIGDRRLKASRPARVYLDRAEQIAVLLDAAGRIDAESRPDQRLPRRSSRTKAVVHADRLLASA